MYQIYRDAKQEFRWRLLDEDGQIIAVSGEGHPSNQECRAEIDRVKERSQTAGFDDSSDSQYQCRMAISDGKDTNTITLHEDSMPDHPNHYNGWSASYAEAVVRKAAEIAGAFDVSVITFSHYSSSRVSPDKGYSEVAYLETNIGYFFVMRDMVDHINVVYNRWD